MGYAKYIGRVGALAVTLGVGVAMATTPGIAYADSTDTATPGSSTGTVTGDGGGENTGQDAPPTGPVNGVEGENNLTGEQAPKDGQDAENAGQTKETEQAEFADILKDDLENGLEESLAEDEEESAEQNGSESVTAPSNGETSTAGVPPAAGELNHHAATDGQTNLSATNRSLTANVNAFQFNLTDAGATADRSAQFTGQTSVADTTGATQQPTGTTTDASTFASMVSTPVVTQAPPDLIRLVTEVVSSLVSVVLQPLIGTGPGSPIQMPILSAMLFAVRNEMERNLFGQTAPVLSEQTVATLVDPNQHVLVIGIDGANLSRILALDDEENENFRALMAESTNSAPSIVGHTTLSNPSWTAILVGDWGEKTGVINNVFTPWTYDKFPTVFNQLEALPGEIDTMTIADWDVINAISGSGSAPVDENVFVAQLEGDTRWLATDDKVAQLTADAIASADPPDFMFSYFVSVDENGHMFGGASPEYREALVNMDDNLGLIMDAVREREKCDPGPCENWTVIVVTDHGHQPQKGFGHGFQSPDETATFVIARGDDFGDGLFNPDYEIVDTTPTVVALFGGTPKPGSDGVTLMSLSGSDEDPGDFDGLRAALEAQLAANQPPDFITDTALTLRTIFASIPYFVYNFGLPSPIHEVLYIVTNIPAQIVALLTGVHGASIFPILPPPPPSDFIGDPETMTLLADNCAAGPDEEACLAV